MIDAYKSIAAPTIGEFKDRASKFIAFAYPIADEAAALAQLESLRKLHFKANHHCYAWRLLADRSVFRANDDGEPSGTAGRPILNQIDALELTHVAIIVVRYFGGTLLGASGLINAYRESAAEALRQAIVVEHILTDPITLDFDYALMPDVMHAVKKMNLNIIRESYQDRAQMQLAIRKREVKESLLQLKASILKKSTEEADLLDWPGGMTAVLPK
jgi:uncharacterized YigZ family protein